MTLTAERSLELVSAEESVAPSSRWSWTRDEYHRAFDLGLFGDTRVELLDGEILIMAGQKTPHFTSVQLAADLLEEAFGAGYRVRQQGPIVLSDNSEPEPDVAVAPGTINNYADHHPVPSELRLIVEISDATLALDRGKKMISYARERISEYWIVNLNNRQLEVFRDPVTAVSGSFYKTTLILLDGDSVSPLHAPLSSIAVSDLLPPRLIDTRED